MASHWPFISPGMNQNRPVGICRAKVSARMGTVFSEEELREKRGKP
jgi:hypothetical protein